MPLPICLSIALKLNFAIKTYEEYMEKLVSSFNLAAAEGTVSGSDHVAMTADGTVTSTRFSNCLLKRTVRRKVFDWNAEELLCERLNR